MLHTLRQHLIQRLGTVIADLDDLLVWRYVRYKTKTYWSIHLSQTAYFFLVPVIVGMVLPLIYKSTMMKQELTNKQEKQSIRLNRFAYVAYIILVIYQLTKGDIEWAIINLGVAMAFDPFDAKVKWEDRPFYQRAWLLIHLALTFTGFLHLILR